MERRIEVPDSPRRALYVGTLFSVRTAQRSPESQLEFFDWGIRLKVGTLLRRPSEWYEIRYEELTEACFVRETDYSGVRFRAEFLPQPLIFLTVDGREILDHLEQRGVTVNRNVTSSPPAGLPRRRAAAARRSLGIPLGAVIVLGTLGFIAVELVLWGVGAQMNFQTLRSDLAKVHLPSGYRLATERQAGTDCHQSCSLTQTWVWSPGHGRTPSGACSDAQHAMAAAFSGVSPNSPVPVSAACDYYTIVDSLLHPGQRRRTVEAIVQTGTHASGGFEVKLVAFYQFP